MNSNFIKITLLLLPFILAACGEKMKQEDLTFTEDDVAIEVGRDVEILYSDSALVRVRIQAPLLHNMNTRDGLKQDFPEGVKVDFFDQNKRIRSVLTSKMAKRDQKTATIIATDSVVVTTIQKEKLETEELIWNEKEQTLHTDKFVKITRPDEVLFGFGLDANEDFSYWKIKAPTGTLKGEQIEGL